MEHTIGVDIGGTQTRVAAVEEGQILARRAFPTRGIREVERAIREVLVEVGWPQPTAIGVGAPAPMDMRAGRILGCPNLPHWNGVAVTQDLGRAFGCPVSLANDATCAAIGELAYGCRARDFVYLTWSTGIGGGVVSGGRVVWGASGQAGEIGHIVLEPDGPPCACGKRGCLEALAGGASLARRAAAELGTPLSARELVERAAHDAAARRLIASACRALGQGIAILWEILEPERIVLGGGLTGSWATLGPQVLSAARAMARGEPRLERTRLGDDVGLLGAAALPSHLPTDWWGGYSPSA
ncbi:ROK family protein [Candidatus Bipolaricaulota bacterium]|nr:ROK family protein [Candidatus Bipolaricaulota bacterium]